jgi:hypothetical protein
MTNAQMTKRDSGRMQYVDGHRVTHEYPRLVVRRIV